MPAIHLLCPSLAPGQISGIVPCADGSFVLLTDTLVYQATIIGTTLKVKRLAGGFRWPTSAAVWRDGSIAVADFGNDRLVKVFRHNRTLRTVQIGEQSPLPSNVAILRDGSVVVFEGMHTAGRVKNIAVDYRGNCDVRSSAVADTSYKVAFLPNGAVAGTDGTAGITVWEPSGKQTRLIASGARGTMFTLAADCLGQLVMLTTDDDASYTLSVVDLATKTSRVAYDQPFYGPTAYAIDNYGRVLTCSAGGCKLVYDIGLGPGYSPQWSTILWSRGKAAAANMPESARKAVWTLLLVACRLQALPIELWHEILRCCDVLDLGYSSGTARELAGLLHSNTSSITKKTAAIEPTQAAT